MKPADIVIIGAGPSGIAAAIQLKRYGLNLIVLEKNKIGGLLRSANKVENYPGFPEGISGLNLVDLLEQHVKRYDVEIIFHEVIDLDWQKKFFAIKCANAEYYSKLLIIGTGTKPKRFRDINISNETERNIIYDITSILKEKGKRIAIIGAGDAAFDYALNLAKHNQVFIFNRGTEIKCIPILWQMANESSNVEYHENTKISSISAIANDRLRIGISRESEISTMDFDYLIPALGRVPQLDFISSNLKAKLIELEQEGFLYFIGDVKNNLYRQTAIAAGDGIKAAMAAYSKLRTIRD